MLNQTHQVEKESGKAETAVTCRRRRQFTVEDKERITMEAKACRTRGELTALLRREDITHSHLATWRERFELHGIAGLATRRPGPKPSDDERDRLIQEQRRAILELERELSIVKGLVEIQKKAQEILRNSQPRIDEIKD